MLRGSRIAIFAPENDARPCHRAIVGSLVYRRALEEPAPPPEVSPHRMLRGQIGQPDVSSVRRPIRV